MFLHLISREKAIELGTLFYFTGLPCKNGHICARRVNKKRGGHCLLCEYERMRTEKAREYGRKHRRRTYHADKFAGNSLGSDGSCCLYIYILTKGETNRIGYGISQQPLLREAAHSRSAASVEWSFTEEALCCFKDGLVAWHIESLFKVLFKAATKGEVEGFKVESVEYCPKILKRMLDILHAAGDDTLNCNDN
jgi:hypothetical protein